MTSYTNTDMYAPLMAYIGNRFGKDNDAYIGFFDIDAPGDDNGAFHSSDLRYLFGRLDTSWRPYTLKDRLISEKMMDYFAAYAKTGNPNGEGRPYWKPCSSGKLHILCFRQNRIAAGRPSYRTLGRNMIRKGNPKA